MVTSVANLDVAAIGHFLQQSQKARLEIYSSSDCEKKTN
jgi:hypothetical protein